MYCMYVPRVPCECCILGSVKAILPILPLSPARIQICVWGWHGTYCSGCCNVTCPTNKTLPVSHRYVAVMSNSRHVQLRVCVGAFIYVKCPLLICGHTILFKMDGRKMFPNDANEQIKEKLK